MTSAIPSGRIDRSVTSTRSAASARKVGEIVKRSTLDIEQSHALADEQAQCHGNEHQQQRVRQHKRADHQDVVQRAFSSLAGSNSRVQVTMVSGLT